MKSTGIFLSDRGIFIYFSKIRYLGTFPLKFVGERLFECKKSFFDPICKNYIKTGLEKKKKTLKKMSLLQEDCQAFGMLVAKATSLEEAFQIPLTTVPLSIFEGLNELRSSDKSALRNYIIRDADAAENSYPIRAKWIIDGMAIIRATKPEATYGDFFQTILQSCMPPKDANAIYVEIIMDKYLENSVKGCTRKKRGDQSTRVHIRFR